MWVGQIIKVPVVDRKSGNENSETSQKQKTSKLSDQQVEKLAESSLKSVPKKDKRKISPGTKIGPSPTEFWTKMDSSIEESKKVTSQLKKNSPTQE